VVVDELKRRLIETWLGMQHSVIDQWKERLIISVRHSKPVAHGERLLGFVDP